MMVTVLASRSANNCIVVPRTVARRWSSLGREPLTLQWGRRSSSAVPVTLRPGRGSPALRLYLSRSVLDELGLPPGMRMHGALDRRRRRLRLGPVLGVLACRRRDDPTMYGQGTFFRALVSVARRRGVTAYVFAPEDVDWEQGTVQGLSPGRFATGWRRRRYPLPDVVYNRVQNRSLENLPGVQWALRRFQRMAGVALFNRSFLDKWAVYTLLSRSPDVLRHMPRTELLPRELETGSETLQSMAVGGGPLFIKPVDGSLGADIAVLRRQPDATYSYTYYAEDGPVIGTHFASLRHLWVELGPRLGARRYIVQEGIPLATYRGRPFDVRIIAQRGSGGVWRAVSMYARVAAPGERRTNVNVGGRTMSWRAALHVTFGRRARAVARDLLRTARTVADGFSAVQGALVGELAIDIGVDKEGKSWLIELNSKPVRRVGSRISLRRPPPSLTSLLDFSKTLSGF